MGITANTLSSACRHASYSHPYPVGAKCDRALSPMLFHYIFNSNISFTTSPAIFMIEITSPCTQKEYTARS